MSNMQVHHIILTSSGKNGTETLLLQRSYMKDKHWDLKTDQTLTMDNASKFCKLVNFLLLSIEIKLSILSISLNLPERLLLNKNIKQ